MITVQGLENIKRFSLKTELSQVWKRQLKSRFSKIFFKSYYSYSGAKINEYLLEKSRIVTHAPEERNYHVFYELLAGLTEDQKQKYGLMSAEKYFYLNQVKKMILKTHFCIVYLNFIIQGGSCTIDGKLDHEDFQNLMSAMQVIKNHFKKENFLILYL